MDATLVDPGVTAPGIAAIAAALPQTVVENDELAGPLGVDSDWIASRTGVHRRRRAVGETLVDLAAEAGSRALAAANISSGELDLVVVATFTPATAPYSGSARRQYASWAA